MQYGNRVHVAASTKCSRVRPCLLRTRKTGYDTRTMSSTSFMTRILWIGVAGITLIGGLSVFAASSSGVGNIDDLRSWAFFGPIVLGMIALNTGIWLRLFCQRTMLRSSSDSRLNLYISRSKYAVWSHVPRPGRLSTTSTRRTQKRLQSPFPHPAPCRAVPDADRRGDHPTSTARPILRTDPAEAGAKIGGPQPARLHPAEL